MTEREYIARLLEWTRKDLLACCRQAGLTAHQLASNEELARLLWLNVGRLAH